MDIVLIGLGNVATGLGRNFRGAGHNILEILKMKATPARALAYEWESEMTNYSSVINLNDQAYIIAGADSAISEVISNLSLPRKVVAHTAASVPMHVLKKVTDHHGVLYPLQSLRKEMRGLPD